MAIVRYQNATLGWSDGRVDPNGPTVHNLVNFVLTFPTVPYGLVSPQQSTGAAATPSTGVDGATVVLTS